MFAGTATWSDSTTNVTLQSSTWRTQPGTYTVVADATGGTIDGLEASLSGSLLTGATDSPVEGLTVKYTGSVSGTLTYTQGIAAKLEALAQQASNSTDGLITSEIQGKNSSIDTMQDDISDWDVRLAQQRTTLEKQYANLEVALGKLKDQGTWLSGQIASLPQISSGSGG
jgi:flagellar hook-associated protein 2